MPMPPRSPTVPGPHLPAADPDATLALRGCTLLLVEDSRLAAEALRLFCLRFGARLRRADCLRLADRHLATYRPDLVLVDLGLPDGAGQDLIARIARTPLPRPAVVAISGTDAGAASALTAGAVAFLEKPLPPPLSLLALLAPHLPGRPAPPRSPAPATAPPADPAALRDDLAAAAALIAARPDAAGQRYVTGFLAGIARSAGDPALARAAEAAARREQALPDLAALLARRLAALSDMPPPPA